MVQGERDGLGPDRIATVYENITEQKRADVALRESEERQAFLLRLSDVIRAEPDAPSVANAAMRLVAEHMKLDRAYICHLSRDRQWAFIEHECRKPGLASCEGEYDLRTFPNATGHLLSRSLFYPDVQNDPTLSDLDKRSVAAMGMGAVMSAVLARGEGDFIWTITVGMTKPRAWTASELQLLQETAERVWTAIQRAQAEAALRESEERQTLLLTLSDALRATGGLVEIQKTAMRILGEYLEASRAYYFRTEQDEDGGWVHIIEAGYQRDPSQPSNVGRHSLKAFGSWLFDDLDRGEAVRVSNVEDVAGLNEAERATYRAAGVTAFVNVPLLREGDYSAGIAVHDTKPRPWTEAQIELIRDVAARTWEAAERARAEAALMESEERFRQFGEASSDVLWIRGHISSPSCRDRRKTSIFVLRT